MWVLPSTVARLNGLCHQGVKERLLKGWSCLTGSKPLKNVCYSDQRQIECLREFCLSCLGYKGWKILLSFHQESCKNPESGKNLCEAKQFAEVLTTHCFPFHAVLLTTLVAKSHISQVFPRTNSVFL